MTNPAASGAVGHVGVSVRVAIRVAWIVWAVLLALPFFVFLYAVWKLGINEPGTGAPVHQGTSWFLVASGYLLLVVPGSFFWRGHMFKSYWAGQPVEPSKYLFGMISIWAALEVGGLFALLGCLVNNSLLPDLLPALVAFMFFVTLWPSGRAMIRHVGSQEDPQFYEEPR